MLLESPDTVVTDPRRSSQVYSVRPAVRKPVAVFLATMFVFAGFGPAAEEPSKPPTDDRKGEGRLQIRVLGGEGKTPVSAAVVRAYHLESGRVFESTRTGADGECGIAGLPYGYFDLSVETKDGTFVGNQVLNVPPSRALSISLSISAYGDKTSAWWSGKAPRAVPGTNTPATGVAEIHVKTKGEFWKRPAGIAVIAGAVAAVALALSGGGGSSNSVSVSNP
jgi:hypothetical protein